jgi:hypothetical protein
LSYKTLKGELAFLIRPFENILQDVTVTFDHGNVSQTEKLALQFARVEAQIGHKRASSLIESDIFSIGSIGASFDLLRVPSVAIAAVGVLVFTVGTTFWLLSFDRRVDRSLEYLDRETSVPLIMARAEIDTFLTNRTDSEFEYKPGESVFHALLGTNVSSSVQSLLDYYGSVAACVKGRLCDPSIICKALVPEIRSLQQSVAHRVEPNFRDTIKVGVPAANNRTWTEADRLLSAC